MDEAAATNDVRVLKEIVYFARGVYTVVKSDDSKEATVDELIKAGKGLILFLLDSVMCHSIFQSQEFWSKY